LSLGGNFKDIFRVFDNFYAWLRQHQFIQKFRNSDWEGVIKVLVYV